jgi:hypothetical protein
MKTTLRLPVLAMICFSLFQSCQKTHDQEIPSKETETELVTHADDQALVSGEMEAITNELNVPLDKDLVGETQESLICSASLAYENSGNFKKVTINYNGADCAGFRTRSGTILISMPSDIHWKDVGAQITVTYQNIKITRVSDKKSITINGTHTITNVSGGVLLSLLMGQPKIIHGISSNNMSITFDDGSKRVWQVARQRTYTIANNGTVTITGTHQEGNMSNIAEWGTDRFGHPFTTSITEPLIVSGGCQYRLISGKITHERQASSATAVFGLNAQGEPVTCPPGSFYFKLTWTGPLGNTLTYLGSY